MKPRNHCKTIAAGLLASIALTASTPAQTSDAALNALVKKGILTEKEAKDALADQQAQSQTMANKIVVPRGNESKLMLEGILQGNVELGAPDSFLGKFSGPTATSPNKVFPRVRLRRARIGVMGDFYDDFDFKLEGDFSQSDGGLSRTAFSATDIFINYHKYAEAQLKVGQFFAPIGYEMLLPDVGPKNILLSTERSLANQYIVPERQLGVQLWGNPLSSIIPDNKGLLEYRVGVFDGNFRNATGNDNSSFQYVARLETTPISGHLFGQNASWRFGVNGLYSKDGTKNPISWLDSGNTAVNATGDGSLGAFTSTSAFQRRGWGIDQTVTVGPFELTAEYLEQRYMFTAPNVVATGGPAVSRMIVNGYYVQPSYFIWKDKLQLVAKYESFNPGQVDHDNISTMTGGLNWYIHNKNVIAMLDYMHTWSDFRANHPGTGPSKFDEVILRLEMYY